jgi:hypothetical protein
MDADFSDRREPVRGSRSTFAGTVEGKRALKKQNRWVAF